MASSTADLAAALTALSSRLVDIKLEEKKMASLLVAVEPTDSIMSRQLTLFDHLKGSIL